MRIEESKRQDLKKSLENNPDVQKIFERMETLYVFADGKISNIFLGGGSVVRYLLPSDEFGDYDIFAVLSEPYGVLSEPYGVLTNKPLEKIITEFGDTFFGHGNWKNPDPEYIKNHYEGFLVLNGTIEGIEKPVQLMLYSPMLAKTGIPTFSIVGLEVFQDIHRNIVGRGLDNFVCLPTKDINSGCQKRILRYVKRGMPVWKYLFNGLLLYHTSIHDFPEKQEYLGMCLYEAQFEDSGIFKRLNIPNSPVDLLRVKNKWLQNKVNIDRIDILNEADFKFCKTYWSWERTLCQDINIGVEYDRKILF